MIFVVTDTRRTSGSSLLDNRQSSVSTIRGSLFRGTYRQYCGGTQTEPKATRQSDEAKVEMVKKYIP
jgi:predicted transcriptional regulator of viral defense system